MLFVEKEENFLNFVVRREYSGLTASLLHEDFHENLPVGLRSDVLCAPSCLPPGMKSDRLRRRQPA